MADVQDVPHPARVKLVCKFCNAIIACETGSSELFCQHLEESHNIFENQDMVLAVQFLSETQRSMMLKITRTAIRDTLKMRNIDYEEGEEFEEQNRTIFDYPRLEAAPGSKHWNLDVLRRQVSKYLSVQGYGRNLKRLGHGEPPQGWPEEYNWTAFKGTGRGCSKTMLEKIIFGFLSSQNLNAAEFVAEEVAVAVEVEVVAGGEEEEGGEEVEGGESDNGPEKVVETEKARLLKSRQDDLQAKLKAAVNELDDDSQKNVEQTVPVPVAEKSKPNDKGVALRMSKRQKKPARTLKDFVL